MGAAWKCVHVQLVSALWWAWNPRSVPPSPLQGREGGRGLKVFSCLIQCFRSVWISRGFFFFFLNGQHFRRAKSPAAASWSFFFFFLRCCTQMRHCSPQSEVWYVFCVGSGLKKQVARGGLHRRFFKMLHNQETIKPPLSNKTPPRPCSDASALLLAE